MCANGVLLWFCVSPVDPYRQAPMREVSPVVQEGASQTDDVWESELNKEDKEA
jgi:hypothetical protein